MQFTKALQCTVEQEKMHNSTRKEASKYAQAIKEAQSESFFPKTFLEIVSQYNRPFQDSTKSRLLVPS